MRINNFEFSSQDGENLTINKFLPEISKPSPVEDIFRRHIFPFVFKVEKWFLVIWGAERKAPKIGKIQFHIFSFENLFSSHFHRSTDWGTYIRLLTPRRKKIFGCLNLLAFFGSLKSVFLLKKNLNNFSRLLRGLRN